jgi:hypothetical protein
MLGLRFSSSVCCCFRTPSHCGCDLNSAFAHWLAMHCAIAKKLRPAHPAWGAAGGCAGDGDGDDAGAGAGNCVGTATATAAAAVVAVAALGTFTGFTTFFDLSGDGATAVVADAAGAGTLSGIDAAAAAGAGAGAGADSTGPVAAGMIAGDAKAIGVSGVALRPANQYQPAPASTATNRTVTPIPSPFDDLGSGNVKTASG